MNRTIGLIATGIVALAASAPAHAFQFENGTIWPLAVGINGGPKQVVPPEEVAFLHRGQCNAGCTVDILLNDPSRPQSVINGPEGEPPRIGANGDQAIVRVRQGRGGISVEVIGQPGSVAPVLPADEASAPTELQPIPPQPPAPQGPAQQEPVPALSAPPATTQPQSPPPRDQGTSSSPSYIPPPPAPDYEGN